MILDLVKYDHPTITSKAEPFDFTRPQRDPSELAVDLVETMLAHGALGISAPQVGVGLRVIALASNPCGVLFNPKIVSFSEATTDLEEGCLTYPGLLVSVKRSRIIRVRFTLANGNVVTKQFSDFTARVIQHEIDHLDGVTLLNVHTGVKRDFIKKRWNKIGKPRMWLPHVITPIDVVTAVERQLRIEDKLRQGSVQDVKQLA